MSLDDAREITPVVFFPPGSQESSASVWDARPKAAEEEPEETPVPKDSSAPASVSSSSEPVVPEQTKLVDPSLLSQVPPAPPVPAAIADKDSGPRKESESSTPTGS